MQAVILAAGRSTRTHPLTARTPKALYELAGHAVIEHNLRSLEGLIDEAVIVIGFEGKRIIRRLGSDYRGIRLRYVEQTEQLGTAHALLCAADKLNGEALVLMGDDLYRNDLLEELLRHPYAVLAQRVKEPSRFGILLTSGEKVTGLEEKPQEYVGDLANTGCYKITHGFLDLLKSLKPSPRGELEITDALGELARRGELRWVESNGGWFPIGYPWHLLEANTLLLQDRPLKRYNIKSRLLSDVHRCITVNVLEDTWIGRGSLVADRVMISRNCYLHPGVQVTNRTSIGPNTQIGSGTLIDNCLIGANVQIGRGCLLSGCVIADDVVIGDRVTTLNETPDNGSVTSAIKGRPVEVDRRGFSAAIGPGARVAPLGILLPGSKIGADTQTSLGQLVDGDLGEIWPEE